MLSEYKWCYSKQQQQQHNDHSGDKITDRCREVTFVERLLLERLVQKKTARNTFTYNNAEMLYKPFIRVQGYLKFHHLFSYSLLNHYLFKEAGIDVLTI